VSEPKDFHITVKVRNARLVRRMRECGYTTASALAAACGQTPQKICELLLMKIKPVLVSGDWSAAAYAVSAALKCEPEDLWPAQIAALQARQGVVSFEASMDDVQRLTTPSPERPLGAAAMRKLLSVLSPRERGVIEQRYGLAGGEATLEDLAQEQGVGRERIRQIEAKALRLLKTKATRMGIGG
jgi:hypothetical protein